MSTLIIPYFTDEEIEAWRDKVKVTQLTSYRAVWLQSPCLSPLCHKYRS